MRLYGLTIRIYNRNPSTFRLRPRFHRANNEKLVVLSCCCVFQRVRNERHLVETVRLRRSNVIGRTFVFRETRYSI